MPSNHFCALVLKKALYEMGSVYLMREREEGNEIRAALPTITSHIPSLGINVSCACIKKPPLYCTSVVLKWARNLEPGSKLLFGYIKKKTRNNKKHFGIFWK